MQRNEKSEEIKADKMNMDYNNYRGLSTDQELNIKILLTQNKKLHRQ